MILLHTFWSLIFFNAADNQLRGHIAYVVISHLFVSCITLLNVIQLYSVTLTSSIIVTIATGLMAFKVVGGSLESFKRFITCK